MRVCTKASLRGEHCPRLSSSSRWLSQAPGGSNSLLEDLVSLVGHHYP